MAFRSPLCRASAPRHVRRRALALALVTLPPLSLLPAGAARAQAPAAGLQTIVVTGARDALPAERLIGDVIVIDESRLRDAVADSVEDLLRREAGVQVSRNGGPGQNAGLLIRGAAATSTVVLIDGVRVGSATLGLASLADLSLAQVERIEVLRGPASSLYGADAVGGVVQVFTRRGRGPATLQARVAAGQRGGVEASASVAGAQGPVDYALSASTERGDGVSALRPGDAFGLYNPDADGFDRRGVAAQVGFAPAAGHRVGLSVNASRMDSQFDSAEYPPPTFAPDPSPDFRNDGRQRLWRLAHEGRWTETLSTRAATSRQVDDLSSGGTTRERYRTERTQHTLQADWRAAAGHDLSLALERLDESADAAVFGTSPRRTNDAVVLAWAGTAGRLTGQAEARHDDSSTHGGVSTGRLGAAVALDGGWRLRALAATTFRAPSFNELAFPGYGVATLRPEKGRSVEAGVQWAGADSRVDATLYRNRVRDLIGYQADPAQCPGALPGGGNPDFPFGCAGNVARATLQGLSLTGRHRIGDLALRAGWEWLDAEDADTGARLPRRAAHQGTLAAEWDVGAYRLTAQWLRVGQRPDGGATLAAENTLDLGALWRVAPAWTLEARLLNATDARIEPVRDYQGQPRQAWVGLRYDGGAAR